MTPLGIAAYMNSNRSEVQRLSGHNRVGHDDSLGIIISKSLVLAGEGGWLECIRIAIGVSSPLRNTSGPDILT